MADLNELRRSIDVLSVADRKEVAFAAVSDLSNDEKKDVLARLSPPEPKTNNAIWLIVVTAFAAVFVGAFVALAAGVFMDRKVDLMLTAFMTTSAFLAGLLVPSPVSNKS